MDKNTITGLLLIVAIMFGFSYFNKPSEEELALAKAKAKQEQLELLKQEQESAQGSEKRDDYSLLDSSVELNDSLRAIEMKGRFGSFSNLISGEREFVTLENNLMKVTLLNRGGRVYSVELKNYKRHDGSPLILFDGDANKFGANFFVNNRSIDTDKLYFTPVGDINGAITGAEVPKGSEGYKEYNDENPGASSSIGMQLKTDRGEHLEFKYTLTHNSYLVGFDIISEGFDQVLGRDAGAVEVTWDVEVPRQEKVSKFGEDNYTTVMYKFLGDDSVESLSTSDEDSENLTASIDWIAYKQLFFTSALIAPEGGIKGADITSTKLTDNPDYISTFSTKLTLPIGAKSREVIPMNFYFGPNSYPLLKQYDSNMEDLLQLGWAIFGWVNKYIVIPAFGFLGKYISNYGIIILLLTIYIKLIILPFTYKSYQSQAKMKALKPEIEELKKKFEGKDKAMELQQATMALYKKAGVNPMGGCIPQLFQMPILFAMFRFFPVSIELRQAGFLWVSDLSSYDSILELPFTIPFYGDHVSLFCLLMTAANFLTMKTNSEMAGGGQQMPGMKMMMYMMPVMLLVFFNNYAAGLSYYYFIATLITFAQTMFFRRMIDENKIREQINENKKKPVKKSKFQQRLEDMQKQQQAAKK